MNEDTYVILPIFNEGRVLKKVLDKVLSSYSNVVCINDGSTDNSGEIISRTKAVLINHPFNLGQGASIQTGVEYALSRPSAKYFITFDADGQHDIADASKMLEFLKKNKLDVVLGSRFMGKSENITISKKALLKLAAFFSGAISAINLTDPHIGLRVFNREFAKNLKLSMPDFSHATELIYRIKEGNYKYAEFPVLVTYTAYSKLKGQPMLNAVNIVFDLLINKVIKK